MNKAILSVSFLVLLAVLASACAPVTSSVSKRPAFAALDSVTTVDRRSPESVSAKGLAVVTLLISHSTYDKDLKSSSIPMHPSVVKMDSPVEMDKFQSDCSGQVDAENLNDVAFVVVEMKSTPEEIKANVPRSSFKLTLTGNNGKFKLAPSDDTINRHAQAMVYVKKNARSIQVYYVPSTD